MQLLKEQAVVICKDYGLAMADGWEVQRLSSKLAKVIQLARQGEYEPSKDLVDEVASLCDSELVEIVDSLDEVDGEEQMDATDEREEHDDDWDDVPEEKEEETKEEVEGEEDTRDRCPIPLRQRVLVGATDGKWKGIVVEIISADRVMVKNRHGEEWEENVENLEIVTRKKKKNEDADDREIQELEDKVSAMKGKDKQKKNTAKKGLIRDVVALKLLRNCRDGIDRDAFALETEKRYVKQGMKKSLVASQGAVDRIVKYGVLFGVIERKGKMIFWIENKGE